MNVTQLSIDARVLTAEARVLTAEARVLTAEARAMTAESRAFDAENRSVLQGVSALWRVASSHFIQLIFSLLNSVVFYA